MSIINYLSNSAVSQQLKLNVSCSYNNVYNHEIDILSADKTGFGVFSKKHIQANQLICSNVAKILPNSIDFCDMKLFQYLYLTQDEDPKSYAIVCGEMLFLNHRDKPNSKVIWQENESGLLFANLISIYEINANEELTIKYSDIERYKFEELI